jgi:cytochrome c-type biogenesis protein CcmH
MTGFFVVASLFLIGALLFVVPPLVRLSGHREKLSHGATNLSIHRDQLQELQADLDAGAIDRLQYDAARREVERRMLEETEEASGEAQRQMEPRWGLAIAVVIAVPLLAVPLYAFLGEPAALDPQKVAAPAGGDHALTPEMIAGMVEQLKQRLRDNPDDGEGWQMLAKTTAVLGDFDTSARAYAEASKRAPNDAQLMADYADALAMARGRNLLGPPEAVVEAALKIDPRNVKALALGGTIAFQKQEFAKAVALWRTILEVVPPEAAIAQRIQGSIADAEARASGKAPASAQAAAASPAASPVATIAGNLALAPDAAKSVSPDDTVFIFARAAEGPKMPLAIVRLQVRDLPTAFQLDESMAMAPGMSISKFPNLVVGARVSKSGNAVAQPGDWESTLIPASVGAKGLSLVISQAVR